MLGKITYQVIEDNGGGLHLALFDEHDNCIWFASGWEHNPGALRETIQALAAGETPDDWEGGVEDPQAVYDKLTAYTTGWEVIADESGIYPDGMGAAGRVEFGTNL